MPAAVSTEVPSLLTALRERVVVADGAMGTMLQAAEHTGGGLSIDGDFQGHEGCNEILNLTRPDVVRSVHDAYFAVGCDAVETNTFGSNWAALAEYGIPERIRETALAGARIARESADHWSTPDHPRWVIGSVGPGTKLPTLGHAPYARLRDAYQEQCEAMVEGGVDAILVETAQDLLQVKAAVVGARRAMAATGRRVALIAQVTVELTGTMLLGSEIGAAVAAVEPLGVDVLGMNCATGPAEMSEHLRYLSQHATVPLSVMPNAGLPQLGRSGAEYPLQPAELADALEDFARTYGVGLVGGCCGTTPEHLRQVVERVRGRAVVARTPQVEPAAASLYSAVPFRQDAGVLMVGERTNTNGSKAFREAMLAGDWEKVVDIGREAVREGAHLIDVCVDYVGRDGAVDMREAAARLATASTLPIMLDSTEPPVIEAGLECLGGRAVINSVNFEDGEGPDSRFARVMPIVKEHGAAVVALTIDEEGQARTADWKLRVAERLIATLTGEWGMRSSDILVDFLTFTLGTGQEESRRDGLETIEAIRRLSQSHPEVGTTLGLSNISFGLKPAARVVLNSVFLSECQKAGLTSAIVHASKILPMNRIPDEQREVALDLVHDRRRPDTHPDGAYDPLTAFLDLFEGVDAQDSAKSRAELLLELPLEERLQRRIVDGEKNGLEADLDAAMAEGRKPLAIVNDTLLAGMKVVGELFGSGEMQLPFVLQSAEVMKTAVAHLEPHMEKVEGQEGKGRIVLATVKGDVHDIGKNLVDIILSNNGYTVVNLGIKQPVNAILDAAQEHDADVIGMSGLLVKSTVVMKENLLEMNSRGIASTYPVILGGAALTRAYVEQDLDEVFDGDVKYARDAFEGLRLMDELMAVKRGAVAPEVSAERAAKDAERKARHARSRAIAASRTAREQAPAEPVGRSDVATDNRIPEPPFWGPRVSKGIALADYASWIDERALFLGQWGLRGSRAGQGPSYDELVETEGRPRLRALLSQVQAEGVMQAAVVHGYFPAVSKGDDLLVLDPVSGGERCRFTFPRQKRDRHLCLSDFWRPQESGEVDVVAFQVVTMGSRVSEVAADLFARNAYREYLELHGLSVQLTEALAEFWHARVREELGFAAEDARDLSGILKLEHRGARYAWGYPACPDVEDQTKVAELLEWSRIGVELSEEFQLTPEQSTSAIIAHHPEAKYFAAR
ncbi:MAG: 5-methyltetrahydrofolate--homocysteine methyltransferase [uncultured Frankineae bacterium]|uniref:Methionine synthase n=1 Tax=uncultured Frankineae bacterium TaxID=437475 RepID=A0A6J4L6Y6_9ACTN|nr:MAG: 5-methyltetrahydrofolate--homocysteine methyltransferase [uncultured Frankineae bacterium]